MFWLLWLPAYVFVIILIVGIIKAVMYKDWDELWGHFCMAFLIAIVALFAGIVINLIGSSAYPATSVPDIENPVYLVSFVGDKSISGGFILASGSLNSNETYDYHYYLPGTKKIASGSTNSQKALIVEDTPENPYYVEIKAVCPEKNEFWIIGCSSSIPYTIEFHVPKGSVIQQIYIAP